MPCYMKALGSSTVWKKTLSLPSCLKGCGGVSVLVNGRALPAIRFSILHDTTAVNCKWQRKHLILFSASI